MSINRIKNSKPSKEYWLYGKHTVLSALSNPKRKIKDLAMTQETYNELKSKLSKDLSYRIVERHEIERIVGSYQVHQGIALKTTYLEQPGLKDFLSMHNNEFSTIVILDKINDPQNLGAVLRSSAAFNIDAVIITKDNSVSETAVSAKASCGAIEYVPLISVSNISEAIKNLKNHDYWVIGMDATGEKISTNLYSFKKLVVILGNEGEGIRKLTKENCDFMVSIPICNKVESLNLSNATAIILYELSKRL